MSAHPYAEPWPARGRSLDIRRLIRGCRVHAPNWLLEVVALNLAFGLAFVVRYGAHIPPAYLGYRGALSVALLTGSYTAFDLLFRTYRIVWRYATLIDMAVLGLNLLGVAVTVGFLDIGPFGHDHPLPLSVLVIGSAMGYLLLSHGKLVSRTRRSVARARSGKPLLIFGAGAGGMAVARHLLEESDEHRPVGFIDDDPKKVGRDINGLPVLGTRRELHRLVEKLGIDTVAIAIPSANQQRTRDIANLVITSEARPMLLPSLRDLIEGHRLSLRNVDMEDLVGRPEVFVDMKAIEATFAGKRILITGAAGSIGSEIARQTAELQPAHLVLVDNNETGLAELRDALPPAAVSSIFVASVSDAAAVQRIFADVRPQIVIHAAALKHVDILEEQPHQAVLVNVTGTWVCAQAAEAIGAERFIFISSDKAVEPTGVLGASKRVGERMVTSLVAARTCFAAVRFGNVLGSRGSVLPKFERQIAAGGPITVTHPDIHRFFMSITEAMRLVLQSTAVARPGRIYVLDMGEEIAIAAFAERLARLRGLRVPRDIRIVYTGLRPGERLREKLVADGERTVATVQPKVHEVVDTAGADEEDDWTEIVGRLQAHAATAGSREIGDRLVALANSTRTPVPG